MKKLWLLLPLLLLLSACGTAKETSSKQEIKDLKKVTLVLDYVPNTNHTGIYLAKEKGYYKEAGLNVQIIEPGDNSTSIGLVGADKAQFGVSYQEDVTYAHADGQNIPVKAIATVINIILLDSPPYQTVTSIHQKILKEKHMQVGKVQVKKLS